MSAAGGGGDARFAHAFVRATSQAVSPPTVIPDISSTKNRRFQSTGCSAIEIDPTCCLMASQVDESPSTVWIWDVKQPRLHAVLMLHAPVVSMTWNKHLPVPILLICCAGENHRETVFVWSPLEEAGPYTIQFGDKLSGGAKFYADWISSNTKRPHNSGADASESTDLAESSEICLLVGDPSAHLLVSLGAGPASWMDPDGP